MNIVDIINAYTRIRKIDQTIPDEVLDFMKESAIKALNEPVITINPSLPENFDIHKFKEQWLNEASKIPVIQVQDISVDNFFTDADFKEIWKMARNSDGFIDFKYELTKYVERYKKMK